MRCRPVGTRNRAVVDFGRFFWANKKEKEESDKKFNRKEYNYSSFSRSFTLPEEVAKEEISAKYDNGILMLTLPKNEKATNNTKKISVS